MHTPEPFPDNQGGTSLPTNGNHQNSLSIAQRNALVEGAMYLIPGMSRKFKGSGLEFDDLDQIGYLALVEAAVRYDDSLGISFEDFTYLRLRGSMLDTLRR